MKNLLILLTSAALIAVACQNEIPTQSNQDNGTNFKAATETVEAGSKTSMDADLNIYWSSNDQLAIFQGFNIADKYQVTEKTAGTGYGEFTLITDYSGAVNDNFTAGMEVDINTNIALYPYQENLSCSRKVESEEVNTYVISNVVVPETQYYAADSFGNGSLLMAAVTQTLGDRNLKFMNVLGAMKLQLLGTEVVKSVKIEGKNAEKLSGTADITAYGDGRAPVITMPDDAAEAVILDCGEGVELSTSKATSFIIALPPVDFANGFKITLTMSEGEEKVLETTAASAQTNKILRSTLLSMPVKDLSGMVHLTFTESNENIANPERGFYEARSTTGYPLSESHIEKARVNKRTIFHIGHYLPPTSDIPDDFLERIRKEMTWLRNGGAKCVLRFSYSNDYDEKPWDATPEQILRHIEQLKPILQENSDVIITLQAGFVGIWGEWYYTDNFDKENGDDDYELRKTVVDAMLDAMPQDRSIALRTPLFKKMMYAGSYNNKLTDATAYNGSDLARLSCFNDCFGASSSDQGTFSGNDSREYWKNETKYVFMGGETCDVSDYCKCNQSLKDMEDFHWSYLNNDYNKDVISRWETDNCLDEIKRRLGYRLSLTEVYHSSGSYAGEDFKVKIGIKNSGFAAPMNPRGIELVLIDGNGTKTTYDLSSNVDPRYWFAGDTYTFETTIKLPSNAKGDCVLYLNLPDPMSTLKSNPLFSIRLANDGIWNDETGYNKLCEFTIGKTIVPEPEPEPGNGEENASATATGEKVTYTNTYNPWN